MKRVVLIFLIVALSNSVDLFSCTNFLVTRAASVDNTTMITYAADAHVLYGELYFRPAKDYPEGAMLDIHEWDTGKYLGKIKQARHTYSVVGNI
ncbi:MAG: dipeptidase, partial [Bacteroidota bacterium]